MKTVMLVFGTRPEAIKMAPLVKELINHSYLSPCVCLTAQHRSMLDQVMDFFELNADYDLDLMRPNQSLIKLAGKALEGLSDVINEVEPAAILVQGDTTSTLCGALAGFYSRVPVGHVEAGLRTGDIYSPYPEEMNRLLSTRLAKWHFAPTETNKANLINEGVGQEDIFVTGNTVIDALFWARDKQKDSVGFGKDQIRPYILITGHRRESFGTGFESICKAISTLAKHCPDYDFIYPMHLNPNVREPVNRILGNLSNVRLIEPLSYPEFVSLMSDAYFILTDSGGVQEEAPSLGKPVLVMRETTERKEGLGGGVCLVGTNAEIIVNEGLKLIKDKKHYQIMSEAQNPYGDGLAAKKIIEVLSRDLVAI